MSLITVAESEAFLDPEIYPSWEGVTDELKEYHIERASQYIALNWDCLEVDSSLDWSDATTIPESIKAVIAQYANADAQGALYPDTPGAEGATPAIKKKTSKVGSLEQTVEYVGSDRAGISGNTHIDDALLYLGCSKTRRKGALTRT